jgi:thiamine monophosphate kinase
MVVNIIRVPNYINEIMNSFRDVIHQDILVWNLHFNHDMTIVMWGTKLCPFDN